MPLKSYKVAILCVDQYVQITAIAIGTVKYSAEYTRVLHLKTADSLAYYFMASRERDRGFHSGSQFRQASSARHCKFVDCCWANDRAVYQTYGLKP